MYIELMDRIISITTTNLVTFAEAAKILSVSRPTVYNWVRDNKLHPVQIGANQYLLRADVDALRLRTGIPK